MIDRETVRRLANEAGMVFAGDSTMAMLERFAALVAAHEREACAKMCDEQVDSPALAPLEKYRAGFIADAIRSRT